MRILLLSFCLLIGIESVAIADPRIIEQGEVSWNLSISDSQSVKIMNGNYSMEVDDNGSYSYSLSGYFSSSDQLKADLGLVDEQASTIFQGRFEEEYTISPDLERVSYHGTFTLEEFESGLQVPIEVSIEKTGNEITGHLIEGIEFGVIDSPEIPLEINASSPFFILTPMFMLGLGFDRWLPASDETKRTQVPFIEFISRFTPNAISTDPFQIGMIDLRWLESQQFQSKEPQATIYPVKKAAIQFGKSIIWNAYFDQQNRILSWAVPIAPTELRIWRSDLLPAGFELISINSSSSLLARLGLWASLLIIMGAIAGAILLRHRWILPFRRLSSALSSGSSYDSLVPLPKAAPKEVAQIQRAFVKVEERAETSEALRDQLIHDVAHELRTPISVIRADLEALLDDVYKPSPEKLMTLHDKTLLLQRLVDDLQQLMQAESGQLNLELEEVNPSELLGSAADAFAIPLEESDIELHLDFEADLPTLRCDRTRLQQVLFNLLENARRHTPPGEEITLEATIAEQMIRIKVSDTGEGIPEADLPHVFERFYRANNARDRKSGGTGLGLSICKYVIEAHGGSIKAMSPGVGQGSEFIILLPVSTA